MASGVTCRFVFIVLFVRFIFPLENGMSQAVNSTNLSEGIQKLEISLPGGTKVRCSASIPPIEADEKVPLILALHYGGEVVPYYGMTFLKILVEPAFKDLGAIIITPDCPGRGWTDPLSEKIITELLKYGTEFWPVDETKIVITGFSMGGFGTWYYGSKYPDIFSAAIPLAGRPTGEAEMQIPVYALHGQFDEIVDIEPTKKEIKKLKKKGLNAKLYIVQGLTHYQTNEYAPYLQKTEKWLQTIWKENAKGPQ